MQAVKGFKYLYLRKVTFYVRGNLNLMALGISRFTALHLKDKFDLEAEVYLGKMSKMNLELIKMPSMCMKELKELIS